MASALEVQRLKELVDTWQAKYVDMIRRRENGHNVSSGAINAAAQKVKGLKAELAAAQKTGGSGSGSKKTGSGSSGGGGQAAAPAGPSQSEIEDLVRQQYGYLAAYLDHPEIGPVLREAAKNKEDIYKLQGRLFKTSWWQQTGSNVRQWDAQMITDPASANEKIKQKQADVWDLANNLGLASISGDHAKEIATRALREGWSQAQLVDALGGEINYAGPLSGIAGQTEVALKKMAGDYLDPWTDGVLHQKIKRVVLGESSIEDFRNEAIQHAKAMTPYYSDALDRGQTLDEIADPYRQLYSKTLGVDPSTVSFQDPKFLKAIAYKDPKDGTSRPMQFDEWQSAIKNDPVYGYNGSKQGIQDAATFTEQLQQKFGFAAA